MQPQDADQLDDAWAAMILDNNRPWIDDEGLREDTDLLWADLRQQIPEAFTDCGCNDHASGDHSQRVPDPVEILLSVDGMSSINAFEAVDPAEWRIAGRPLTRAEMKAVYDMEPVGFARYHRAQEQHTTD